MAQRKKPDPKTKTLREHGVLNPRPEDVRDDLFVEGGFFDARDLVQVRYEMLRRVRTEGHAVTETTSRYGVSRPTYYKACADFERAGLAGLVPRQRGPKGGHKLTAEVVKEMQRALDEDPSLDAKALVELVKHRFGIQIHRRSVERALERQKKKR